MNNTIHLIELQAAKSYSKVYKTKECTGLN